MSRIVVAALAVLSSPLLARAGTLLYVSNFDGASGHATVSAIAADGTVSPFDTGVTYPWGLAFDSSGSLYVVNEGGGPGSINKITPGGTISTFATGFFLPTGLAVDSADNLYVAHAAGNSTNVIDKITPSGTVTPFSTGVSGEGFGNSGNALALVCDSSGNLYTESHNNIDKIAPDGTISIFATGVPSPSGMTFDSSGNLYFSANSGGGMIGKITPGGTISTFAAGLDNPWGLAFDSLGDLYVANMGENTVSEITPDGTVSIFATGLANPEYMVAAPVTGQAVPIPTAFYPGLLGLGLVMWELRRRHLAC